MERKMFGHRIKKHKSIQRTPGKPYNDSSENDEGSYSYVKGKDFPPKHKGDRASGAKDGPPGYEGREHVKYKAPGYSKHDIRFPEDEPHMKSRVNKNEMHEMEDNYHMSVPNQTKYELEAKIKRARMKMDAPDQEDPDYLRGNITHNVGYEGEKDETGQEEMGPNDMQSGMSKEHRKKMIVAITRRKMKKNDGK